MANNNGSLTIEAIVGLDLRIKKSITPIVDTAVGINIPVKVAASASDTAITLPSWTTMSGTLIILDDDNTGDLSVKINSVNSARLLGPMHVISISTTYTLTALTVSNASTTKTRNLRIIGVLNSSP